MYMDIGKGHLPPFQGDPYDERPTATIMASLTTNFYQIASLHFNLSMKRMKFGRNPLFRCIHHLIM